MWASKKKLKEIEDKIKLIDLNYGKFLRRQEAWAESESKKADAHRERSDARDADNRAAFERHNALVEKFLETMVKALERN